MKKLATLLICILSLLMPINAQAHNLSTPVYSGYTEEGIYYEVYVADSFDNYATYRSGVPYTLFIEFDGYTRPNPTYYRTITLNGVKYAGLLELQSFIYANGKTTAKYSGYVYPIS